MRASGAWLFIFVSAVFAQGDSWEQEFKEALHLYETRPAREALPVFENLTARNPNHQQAHYKLGVILFRTGYYDRSKQEFEAAVRLDPNDADAHYNLGYVLTWTGRCSEALAPLKAAVSLSPGDLMNVEALGYSYECQGLWSEARAFYSEAIPRVPYYKRQELVLRRGAAALGSHDREGAIADSERAIASSGKISVIGQRASVILSIAKLGTPSALTSTNDPIPLDEIEQNAVRAFRLLSAGERDQARQIVTDSKFCIANLSLLHAIALSDLEALGLNVKDVHPCGFRLVPEPPFQKNEAASTTPVTATKRGAAPALEPAPEPVPAWIDLLHSPGNPEATVATEENEYVKIDWRTGTCSCPRIPFSRKRRNITIQIINTNKALYDYSLTVSSANALRPDLEQVRNLNSVNRPSEMPLAPGNYSEPSCNEAWSDIRSKAALVGALLANDVRLNPRLQAGAPPKSMPVENSLAALKEFFSSSQWRALTEAWQVARGSACIPGNSVGVDSQLRHFYETLEQLHETNLDQTQQTLMQVPVYVLPAELAFRISETRDGFVTNEKEFSCRLVPFYPFRYSVGVVTGRAWAEPGQSLWTAATFLGVFRFLPNATISPAFTAGIAVSVTGSPRTAWFIGAGPSFRHRINFTPGILIHSGPNTAGATFGTSVSVQIW